MFYSIIHCFFPPQLLVLVKLFSRRLTILIKKQDESAVIICTHNIPSYYRILWYKQSPDMLGFKLMGYLNYDKENKELEFENKIKLEGDGQKNGTLTIRNLRLNDSAVYFCAAYYTVLRITSDTKNTFNRLTSMKGIFISLHTCGF